MIEYRIHPQPVGLAVTVWSGRIVDADLIPSYARVYSDSEWRAGFHELADLRNADMVGVTAGGLRALTDFVSETLGGSGVECRSAVVTPRDLAFGIARIYEALSADSPETVQVFRDLQAALDWLGVSLDHFEGQQPA